MKVAVAAVLSALGSAPMTSAQTMSAPVQFIGVHADGGGPKAWFIERPPRPEGIKDYHEFWFIGLRGAPLPEAADRGQVGLIFPCGERRYEQFSELLWRGDEVVGGDPNPTRLKPVPPGSSYAMLRGAVCDPGARPSGPLLTSVAQMRAVAEAAAPKR